MHVHEVIHEFHCVCKGALVILYNYFMCTSFFCNEKRIGIRWDGSIRFKSSFNQVDTL